MSTPHDILDRAQDALNDDMRRTGRVQLPDPFTPHDPDEVDIAFGLRQTLVDCTRALVEAITE